jgi:hypothetical protein
MRTEQSGFCRATHQLARFRFRVGIATVGIFHLKSPDLHTHWAAFERWATISPCPRRYTHFSWSPSAASATWGKVAIGRAAEAAGIA